MKLPKADISLPIIHRDYADYFLAAQNVWGLCSRFIDENSKIGAGKEYYFTHCLTGAYTKQMRLSLSVYLLCHEGMSQEAGILLRSMFETYIHLIALKKCDNPTEFARLWIVWELARDSVCYAGIKKHNDDIPEFPPELSEIVAETRNKLGDKWKNFKAHGPSGESVEELCKKINMTGSYDTLYRIASKSVHSSDLSFYSKPLNEDGGILCQFSPEASNITSVIPSMIVMLRDSVIMFNELMELGKQQEAEELNNTVEVFIASEKGFRGNSR